MRIHLLLLIIVSLTSCESSEECGPNPGCPPPSLNESTLRFQLADSRDQVIDLNEGDVERIKWTIANSEFEQTVLLDTIQNIGVVLLREQSMELANISYHLTSDFGEPQLIEVFLGSKALFEDECNPCQQYFIASIRQNESEVLFSGELTEQDVIVIKLE